MCVCVCGEVGKILLSNAGGVAGPDIVKWVKILNETSADEVTNFR